MKTQGIGIGGVLFVVFLVLKLCDKITWSWWWVTSPLWLPASVILAVCAVLVMASAVAKAMDV